MLLVNLWPSHHYNWESFDCLAKTKPTQIHYRTLKSWSMSKVVPNFSYLFDFLWKMPFLKTISPNFIAGMCVSEYIDILCTFYPVDTTLAKFNQSSLDLSFYHFATLSFIIAQHWEHIDYGINWELRDSKWKIKWKRLYKNAKNSFEKIVKPLA